MPGIATHSLPFRASPISSLHSARQPVTGMGLLLPDRWCVTESQLFRGSLTAEVVPGSAGLQEGEARRLSEWLNDWVLYEATVWQCSDIWWDGPERVSPIDQHGRTVRPGWWYIRTVSGSARGLLGSLIGTLLTTVLDGPFESREVARGVLTGATEPGKAYRPTAEEQPSCIVDVTRLVDRLMTGDSVVVHTEHQARAVTGGLFRRVGHLTATPEAHLDRQIDRIEITWPESGRWRAIGKRTRTPGPRSSANGISGGRGADLQLPLL